MLFVCLISVILLEYSLVRQELLAVVVFTRHFRSFLLGGMFTVRTDHGSLTWLKNFKEPEGQMARWLERLQEFDFTIVHRRGKKHTNADSLSRLPCRQCGRENHGQEVIVTNTSLSETINFPQEQLNKSTTGPVLRAKISGQRPPDSETKALSRQSRRLFQIWDQLTMDNGRLYRLYQNDMDDDDKVIQQLVIPLSKRSEVFKEMHEEGHLGEDKTLARVCERFYWPGYHNDVCDWC